MPLQFRLHFYKKENYRALKWGLSRAPSAANKGWALDHWSSPSAAPHLPPAKAEAMLMP